MKKMAGAGRVVIIAGGDVGGVDWCRSAIAGGGMVICADGGAAHALEMGLEPDLVVGDGDSLAATARRSLEEMEVRFLDYPAEKDYSDLELALDHVLKLDPQEILIFGALGGARVEHTFANIMLLALPLRKGIPAWILDRQCAITLTDRELAVRGEPGDYLSLFPLAADAEGVTTHGLLYPLNKETLHFASTRGLSNEMLGPEARITLEKGLLLVVRNSRCFQRVIP